MYYTFKFSKIYITISIIFLGNFSSNIQMYEIIVRSSKLSYLFLILVLDFSELSSTVFSYFRTSLFQSSL